MLVRFRVFLILFVGVLVVGTFGFMSVEGRSFGDAFYFTLVTISTVGYGDISPATGPGKMLAVILIITGVGAFLGVIASITEMMIERREREARFKKLNMLTGIFFSEVGRKLLSVCADYDPDVDEVREHLMATEKWTDKDFTAATKNIKNYAYKIDVKKLDLPHLEELLSEKRKLMLELLENPILQEHENFTELLRAVFHLIEELSCREDFSSLPQTDREHLAKDLKRVYTFIVSQWLDYLRFLKEHYTPTCFRFPPA